MSILQLRTSPHGVSYSLVRAQSRLGNLDDDLPDSLPANEVLLRLLHDLAEVFARRLKSRLAL